MLSARGHDSRQQSTAQRDAPAPLNLPRRAAPRGRDRQAALRADLQQRYREIAGRLLLMERPATPWLIGVTSAIAGEGRTTVACGLATTLAADLPERIGLLELDFVQPVIANELGMLARPGLAEVIQQDVPLVSAIRPTPLPNLTVLPAGLPQGGIAQIVHAPRLAHLWSELSLLGSIIICDLPPVLGTPETAFLARHMATLVMTVRAGVTPAPLTQEALDQLDRDRVAGVVLVGEEHRVPAWLRRLLGEW